MAPEAALYTVPLSDIEITYMEEKCMHIIMPNKVLDFFFAIRAHAEKLMLQLPRTLVLIYCRIQLKVSIFNAHLWQRERSLQALQNLTNGIEKEFQLDWIVCLFYSIFLKKYVCAFFQ